jgi:hypothetical protein
MLRNGEGTTWYGFLHSAIADSNISYIWCRHFSREFDVDKREDRRSALRYTLAKPENASAIDAYNEMLGMDVKLHAYVSKANYRMQIMFTSSSKVELEVAARVLVVSSGSLYGRPVVKIAQAISNPQNGPLVPGA